MFLLTAGFLLSSGFLLSACFLLSVGFLPFASFLLSPVLPYRRGWRGGRVCAK